MPSEALTEAQVGKSLCIPGKKFISKCFFREHSQKNDLQSLIEPSFLVLISDLMVI